MSIPLNAPEVLDREFLEIRARLLQVAASLDRIDRGEGSVAADARRQNIQRALVILESADDNRAEQLQLLFSRPYEKSWRQTMAISTEK